MKLIAMLIVSMWNVDRGLCTDCDCFCQKPLDKWLHCFNLTSPGDVPRCVPADTERLDLSANAITFLPDSVFVNLRYLKELFLGANQLQNIPYRAFANVAPRLLGRHEEHIL
ncbi:hypothetical protein ACROYT_G026034 [Oculina patagonica]